MAISNKREFVTVLILAGFGTYVILEARRLPYVSEFGPGPGFFPLWIGIGIIVCSLIMLVAGCLRGGPAGEAENKSAAEIARALGAWAAFVVAIVLLPLLGFAISLGLLSLFLIIALDHRSPWAALGVAVVLASGFYLIFNVALGVALPVGPLGF